MASSYDKDSMLKQIQRLPNGMLKGSDALTTDDYEICEQLKASGLVNEETESDNLIRFVAVEGQTRS